MRTHLLFRGLQKYENGYQLPGRWTDMLWLSHMHNDSRSEKDTARTAKKAKEPADLVALF